MKYILILACCLASCNRTASPKPTSSVDAGIDSGKEQSEDDDDNWYWQFFLDNSYE